MRLTSDGKTLAFVGQNESAKGIRNTASDRRGLHLLHFDNGYEWVNTDGEVKTLATTQAGDILATTEDNQGTVSVVLWNRFREAIIRQPMNREGRIVKAAIAPQGEIMAFADSQNQIHVWKGPNQANLISSYHPIAGPPEIPLEQAMTPKDLSVSNLQGIGSSGVRHSAQLVSTITTESTSPEDNSPDQLLEESAPDILDENQGEAADEERLDTAISESNQEEPQQEEDELEAAESESSSTEEPESENLESGDVSENKLNSPEVSEPKSEAIKPEASEPKENKFDEENLDEPELEGHEPEESDSDKADSKDLEDAEDPDLSEPTQPNTLPEETLLSSDGKVQVAISSGGSVVVSAESYQAGSEQINKVKFWQRTADDYLQVEVKSLPVIPSSHRIRAMSMNETGKKIAFTIKDIERDTYSVKIWDTETRTFLEAIEQALPSIDETSIVQMLPNGKAITVASTEIEDEETPSTTLRIWKFDAQQATELSPNTVPGKVSALTVSDNSETIVMATNKGSDRLNGADDILYGGKSHIHFWQASGEDHPDLSPIPVDGYVKALSVSQQFRNQ